MKDEGESGTERKTHNAFGGINGIDIVLNVVTTLVYTIPTFVSAKFFKGRRRRGGFFLTQRLCTSHLAHIHQKMIRENYVNDSRKPIKVC